MSADSSQIGSDVCFDLCLLASNWTAVSRFVQGKARSETGLQESDE